MKKYNEKIIVAFRTHFWDETTELLAKKLCGMSAGYDFVVICDETNNEIDCSPFEKISHTQSSDKLALPHWPKNYNNLHYNGDYVLYHLYEEKPNYDYYVLSENDTLVNFDLEKIMSNLFENEIDLFARVDEINSQDHAPFHANSRKWYTDFGRAFFPFMAVSNELLNDLYNARKNLSLKVTKEEEWPYCESFVASHTLSNKKYKILNVDDVLFTERYTFMHHKYIGDETLYTKDSISHPIVGNEFYKKNLIVSGAQEVLNEESDLFRGVNALHREKNNEFYNFFEEEIKKLKSKELLSRFYTFAFEKGWVHSLTAENCAFLCTTNQSSTNENSTFADPKEDSSLVVDGIITTATKSHTAFEWQPWIEVDLGVEREIKNILIFVRPNNFHIFNNFFVSFRKENEEYQIVFRKNDGIVPKSNDLKPIILHFSGGNFARYVKITLDSKECLTLNQVEIYSY